MEKISKTNKKNKYGIILYVVIILSTLLVFCGFMSKIQGISVIGIMLAFTYFLLYTFRDLRQRFPLCLMLLMIFTFLLSRPLINVFRGEALWNRSLDSLNLALLSIHISIIFLFLGFEYRNIIAYRIIKTKFYKKIKSGKHSIKKKYNLLESKWFIRFLFYGMLITFLINFALNILSFIDMKNTDYTSFYAANTRSIPKILSFLSELYVYIMCFYLATNPSKWKTILTLGLYGISAIPVFFIGNRGSVVIKIIFIFVYFFLRNSKNLKKYLNYKTGIAFVVFCLLAIMGLGAYNYIRSDEEIPDFSPVQLITDFFYKQGTTFTTVCQGFEHREKLLEQKKENYTFGNIIDYFKYSTISRMIFHTEDLGNGNTVKRALESNNLAHHLSYIVLGKTSYLAGHGRGTSYVIETYLDFGIFGVALFSFIIGMFLKKVSRIGKSGWIMKSLILIVLTKFFLIPRSETIESLEFIVKPQFLILVLIIIIWYFVGKKKANKRTGVKNERGLSTKITQ